jgi:predicted DNA-binding WGR domain protein
MQVSLKRVDAEQRMDRWYTVMVQPTLLDSVAVICAWGSRRNRYQRMKILPVTSAEEAVTSACDIVRRKANRGYYE